SSKLAPPAHRRKHQRPQHVSATTLALPSGHKDSIKSERLTPEEPAISTRPGAISPVSPHAATAHPAMPPGFSAGLGFMLGLQQGPLGGALGPLGQMGHLSPVASPGTPSAPSNAFNPAQLKHMEMVNARLTPPLVCRSGRGCAECAFTRRSASIFARYNVVFACFDIRVEEASLSRSRHLPPP
ncbi:hypothetical protein BIW11_01468, partial [Tropilaelaps mercedesae]